MFLHVFYNKIMNRFLQWKMNNGDKDYINLIMSYVERNIMKPIPGHTVIPTRLIFVNDVMVMNVVIKENFV